VIDYLQIQRHSQIWVQPWAIPILNPQNSNPWHIFALPARLQQQVKETYLSLRHQPHEESLISTVFNQLVSVHSLCQSSTSTENMQASPTYYVPLPDVLLQQISNEVALEISAWTGLRRQELQETGLFSLSAPRMTFFVLLT
jgi:hypothetical protein